MNTMTAPIPQNEKKRLKVLWQYEVLDTVPEEVSVSLTKSRANCAWSRSRPCASWPGTS